MAVLKSYWRHSFCNTYHFYFKTLQNFVLSNFATTNEPTIILLPVFFRQSLTILYLCHAEQRLKILTVWIRPNKVPYRFL